LELFSLNLFQSFRKEKLSKIILKEYKNRVSNMIKKFYYDDFSLERIINIEETNIDFEMSDIETKSHYFICNSIETHNCSDFDIRYIYNRMKKLQLNPNLLSPLNSVDINTNKFGEVFIAGLYLLDLMELYKNFAQSIEESYKLDFIANKILGTGKVEYTGTLDQLYEKDLEKFIKYSTTDCQLLYDINQKLGYIELREEIRKVCSSTWKATETTMGQLDPLCIAFAKRKNLVCKNSECKKPDTNFIGAYVRNPKAGLHSYIVDFDFSSLYPSIIRSMNIGPNTYIGKISEEVSRTYIYDKDNIPDIIYLTINVNTSLPKTIKVKKEKFLEWINKFEAIVTISGTIFKGHNIEESFLSEILKFLMDSRS